MLHKVRATRFGCTPRAKQPLGLRSVVKELERVYRKRGKIGKSKDLRGLFSRADRNYGDRGPADELSRFMLNTGILIETPDGTLLFDAERAEEVMACCEAVTEPTPLTAELITERISALLIARLCDTDDESDDEPVDTLGDAACDAEGTYEEAGAFDTDPSFADVAPEPEPLAPSVTTVATEVAAPDSPPSETLRIMHLTAVEADIWESIVASSARLPLGSWRLAAPSTPEALYERWKTNEVECDEDEYHAAFRRFTDHGLLFDLGSTYDSQRTYALRVDPSSCRVIPIAARVETIVSEAELAAVRAVQGSDGRLPTSYTGKQAIVEWVRDRHEAHREYAERLVGAGPLAVIDDDPVTLQWRLCLKGFERYEYVTAVPQSPKPPPEAPKRTPVRSKPTPVPKDLRKESEEKLNAYSSELQRQIDRAMTDVASWTDQLDLIERERKRRRGSKREELQKRLAKLEADRLKAEQELAALED